ncbi:hypothetical protein FQN50_007730 [Emmonsiellopsis sp. PD_5]|nr:hypothetical protein FQN50_007730 [Emmonsiellopsis sp. PD_5]
MSMSTPNAPAATPAPEPQSRTSRLRRLSNFRAITHSHSGPSNSGHRSYRNSLTRAVGLSSASQPAATPDQPCTDKPRSEALEPALARQSAADRHGQCPEPDHQRLSAVGTNLSGSSSSDNLDSHASSSSSLSTPSNDPETCPPTSRAADMVLHRNTASREALVADQASMGNRSPAPSSSNSHNNMLEAGSADSTHTTPKNTPRSMGSSSAREGEPSMSSPEPKEPQNPTIRFYAYQETHHNSRPSLPFTTTSRTLPNESSIIRVGRYSERDGVPVHNPTEPSDAAVGFKSKVVSRRHCEFSFVNGQWHIRDVGSSSGTFLNHMRLSQPNMTSRLYAVRDGDILQLGIDFRGGEEMIFRCVRIRVECNRTWQQKANEFNKNTASLINNLGKGNNAADYAGCRECSICLGSVLRPYQCLFMAACAHVWHYKCIRRLIHSPEYPMFQCPNCRAYTDLSAEVDDSNDPFEDEAAAEPPNSRDQPVQDTVSPNNLTPPRLPNSTAGRLSPSSANRPSDDDRLAAAMRNVNIEANSSRPRTADRSNAQINGADGASECSRSPNIDIPNNWSPHNQSLRAQAARRQSLQQGEAAGGNEMFEDNPLTPRNDFGPLAFDGRAGRL